MNNSPATQAASAEVSLMQAWCCGTQRCRTHTTLGADKNLYSTQSPKLFCKGLTFCPTLSLLILLELADSVSSLIYNYTTPLVASWWSGLRVEDTLRETPIRWQIGFLKQPDVFECKESLDVDLEKSFGRIWFWERSHKHVRICI